MRYVAFKYENRTDINENTYIPLFDVELDIVSDACKLLRSHVTEPILNARFNMNVCVNDINKKGFSDDVAHDRVYDDYLEVTYVIIEYDFLFASKYEETYNGNHYRFWKRAADKMIRDLKIKTVLDD